MGKEQARRKRRGEKRRSRGNNVDCIVPDYVPSTLPLRDMEVPVVTTVNTLRDYLEQDKAMPKDPQFTDTVYVVPIPTEKNFSETPTEITDFLSKLADSPEDASTPYVLSSVQIEDIGYFVVKLRIKYSVGTPARIVLLPKDSTQRTFGIFATEKVLPEYATIDKTLYDMR